MPIERAPDSAVIVAGLREKLSELGLVRSLEPRNGLIAKALDQVVLVKKEDLKVLLDWLLVLNREENRHLDIQVRYRHQL